MEKILSRPFCLGFSVNLGELVEEGRLDPTKDGAKTERLGFPA
jgi:hypothetical protein